MSRKRRAGLSPAPTTMYYIERINNGIWYKIPFAESKTRNYCDGYVDAIDSMYPSDPCRIVKNDKGVISIVRETKGRSAVHTN